MKGTRRVFVVSVVLASLAAGLGCARESVQTSRSDPLEIVADDFSFSGAPRVLTGGTLWIEFSNEGEADHELAVAQIGDTSAERLSNDIAKLEDGGPFPRYMREGMVPFELEPGKSGTSAVTLPEGEYTLFCTLTDAPGEGDNEVAPHATLGMFEKLTVEDADDEALGGEGTFVAKDYTFEVPDDVRPGKDTYAFRNASSDQWHHMILNEYPEGIDEKEAEDAIAKMMALGENDRPPADLPMPDERATQFTGIMGPGFGQTVELDLKEGRTYVAVCFIQDIEGGPPHAVGHKMYEAFTVTG